MTFFPDLADKKIWVTGGAGYLGTPIILALDQAGARTLCLDLPGKAEALCARHNLKNTVPESADVCASDGLPAVLEKLAKTHGTPDGLIHLAFASSSGKRLEELEAEDLSRTLEGGLTANFLLCRFAAERMKAKGGGSVVLFSSMYGLVSPDFAMYQNETKPNPIDYGMSKAGVLQMSRYFAVHYGPSHVRFNCVTPGAFTNPAARHATLDFLERQKKKIPLGRVGEAAEVVGPALFLLSEASSYVTGHSLVTDGGWTIL